MRTITVARLTITIPAAFNERLEELSGENGPYESKAEAVRELTTAGEQLPKVERERDQLRDQLSGVNSRAEDVSELVEYVEGEKELQQRERERRDAPVWRRAAWWVFGRG